MREKRGIAALSLVLLVAAGAVFAEEEEGKGLWSVTGWTRANFGWDFENEAQLPKPDGDWDATGAGTTLTWTRGAWKVAGTAEVTSETFGRTFGGSGNVTTTYAAGDWTVSGKLAQSFGSGDQSADNYGRSAQFSVENWKQADNNWGIKGIAQLKLNVVGDLPILTYDNDSDDNKAAFFINFWDKQILLEGGYGDYTDSVWTTPGPYELQYESADDEDSALRVQFKPSFLSGLNVGFAYLPAIGHTGSNAGLADSSTGTDGFGAWKPVDAIRATSFGAKYAPASGLFTVAAGFNLKEDAEKGYAGLLVKLLDKQLAVYVDTQAYDDSGFGTFDLGEKFVFVDNPDDTGLKIELTLKENRLIRSSDGTAAKDPEFYLNPWVWYEFIDKTAKGQLSFELTKGLGDTNKDHTAWALTTTIGLSVKESVDIDPDNIGTGFVVKYKYGVAEDAYAITNGVGVVTPGKTTTNQLYFGFKASF
jgi:hypothetical protein